ncbi:hypothetical protein O3P69_010256 [Scylla paramamosain]|uniref:Uncharacterized protein n=1 Tax=Scylla paramamosain TaxID=85552 RepID=A0AAW0TRW4_SCYPA
MKDNEFDFTRAIHIAIEVEDAAKVAKETVCGQKPKLVNKVNHMKAPPHHQKSGRTSKMGIKDMDLDRGGCRNYITEELWHKLGTPPLQETRAHYASASQHKMPILDVKLQERCRKLAKDSSELFKSELGCLRGAELEVKFKPNTQPVFHKVRPVPLAPQEELAQVYDSGTTRGIWKPLETQRQPMPLPEDLIQKIGGGCGFSKIDLEDAYNQVNLAPESLEAACS